MIIIDDVLISDDVLEKQFVCNLNKCKGACCIEGDSGAPIEKEERKILKKIFPTIQPFLTQEGIDAIEKQGTYVDETDDEYTAYATPLIDGGACAYINYDANGTVVCGIEQAYNAGVIKYQKPISCHLYPIRLKKMDTLLAMNYDVWDICKDACTLGKKLKIPVYQFLKTPIIRKFGNKFYKVLEQATKTH